jgi:transmembrane sensor
MADLLRQIEQAGAHVQVDWTPDRLQSTERRMMRRKERRARIRTGVAVAAACAVVALVVFFGLDRYRPLPDVPDSTALTPSLDVLRFADGSMATPIRPGTVVRSEAVTDKNVEVIVASGAARFEVTPNPERTFVVRAGEVSVHVVGTKFTVAREERVAVSVERGEVLVTWQDGQRSLKAGQSGQFPPDPGQPVDMELDFESVPSASVPVPARGSARAPTPSAMVEDVPTWRALARQGQHKDAYEALQREGSGAVRDNAEDLMLAADVARLSGHSGQAVAPLQKVVGNHAGDPRAPLAAFTLGRVLLDELGRPGQAAGAFATARRLAPGGALAQDALAREVESLAKAGQAVAARERALEYVKRYPSGRRTNAVRTYGGLE